MRRTGESGMKTEIVRIRIRDSDLESIKKRGGRGKNISETIRDLIHSGLENQPESHHVSGPEMAPETIRKEVDSALKSGLEPALKTIALFRAEISELGKSRTPDPVENVPPMKKILLQGLVLISFANSFPSRINSRFIVFPI